MAKRRVKERQASEMSRAETVTGIWAELRPLLDQEMDRLPGTAADSQYHWAVPAYQGLNAGWRSGQGWFLARTVICICPPRRTPPVTIASCASMEQRESSSTLSLPRVVAG
jgi:hypothetical protein